MNADNNYRAFFKIQVNRLPLLPITYATRYRIQNGPTSRNADLNDCLICRAQKNNNQAFEVSLTGLNLNYRISNEPLWHSA